MASSVMLGTPAVRISSTTRWRGFMPSRDAAARRESPYRRLRAVMGLGLSA